MILFVQTNGPDSTEVIGHGNLSYGKIINKARVCSNGQVSIGGKITYGNLNIVNMKTGQIVCEDSSCKLPEWCRNPLIVAMKLAEWKYQNRKAKVKK